MKNWNYLQKIGNQIYTIVNSNNKYLIYNCKFDLQKTVMPYITIKFSDSKEGDSSHHMIWNFNLLVQSIREIIWLQYTNSTAIIIYWIHIILQDTKNIIFYINILICL
jgi:hypothetical protein